MSAGGRRNSWGAFGLLLHRMDWPAQKPAQPGYIIASVRSRLVQPRVYARTNENLGKEEKRSSHDVINVFDALQEFHARQPEMTVSISMFWDGSCTVRLRDSRS